MHFLHIAALVIVALGVDLIKASGAGHDFVHRSRHFSRRNTANLNQNVTERSLEKRFDGARFTFFAAGLGACGKVNSGSDFIVALNSAQYNGGAHCFETITISAEGKTHSAQIVDECPGCPFGGLDFSEGLFKFFAPESVGVLTGSWNFGGSAAPAPQPAPPPPPKTTHHTTPPPPPPPPPTHTTEHHDPPTTTAPKPKPTSSQKPEDTTQATPSDSKSKTDASSTPSSASATAQSSAALAIPTSVSPSASPSATAGNIALLYANMVYMGSVIVAGNAASSNGA
ncbi:hypothetical protein D9619_005508 [Psilocybe cf. subviscida]|uniref:RlpA-like protein double-psi beta-barrel domain-containing protein n=1 Tax=Psilocybe cf. subviscida TaxID=2480587 RepID=A0A8H5FBR8_9AGAR|nr:hypothetical protein D9619_005508 [Psilocybe cf. subviscida]